LRLPVDLVRERYDLVDQRVEVVAEVGALDVEPCCLQRSLEARHHAAGVTLSRPVHESLAEIAAVESIESIESIEGHCGRHGAPRAARRATCDVLIANTNCERPEQ
jgi:hypothetical protein